MLLNLIHPLHEVVLLNEMHLLLANKFQSLISNIELFLPDHIAYIVFKISELFIPDKFTEFLGHLLELFSLHNPFEAFLYNFNLDLKSFIFFDHSAYFV